MSPSWPMLLGDIPLQPHQAPVNGCRCFWYAWSHSLKTWGELWLPGWVSSLKENSASVPAVLFPCRFGCCLLVFNNLDVKIPQFMKISALLIWLVGNIYHCLRAGQSLYICCWLNISSKPDIRSRTPGYTSVCGSVVYNSLKQ